MKQKKVIVLYGPPGVGKLTVAKELVSKFQGLKLFHVHLLADLVSSLFETGTKEFSDSFAQLWLFLFRKILSTEINGLVVTLIYGIQTLEGKNDDQFFAQIVQAAKDLNYEIVFIKLECSDTELYKRVQSESRKKFKKITDPDILTRIRNNYCVDKQIPLLESIVINTTDLNPVDTTQNIIEKLNLG